MVIQQPLGIGTRMVKYNIDEEDHPLIVEVLDEGVQRLRTLFGL
jgi:hypothetical protein